MRLLMTLFFVGLTGSISGQTAMCSSSVAVNRFYQLVDNDHPWTTQPALLRQLVEVMRQSTDYGLTTHAVLLRYPDSLSKGLLHLTDPSDSVSADLRITTAALCYFEAMATGTGNTPVGYEGLHPSTACIDVVSLLATAVLRGDLTTLPVMVGPTNTLYQALLDTLQSLQLNYCDSAAIPANKTLSPQIVARINALRQAINTVRWLRCLPEEQCILVNIPSATLRYYEKNQLVLSSRVIVGKPFTRTGTLSSEVHEVILYPYWTVPAKIARRKLLPLIKRNPGFLKANGYQILSNGKLIDASSIDWKRYSATYFPFTLRQSTGCDNSMGIIKLNFYSPYGLFLHDTPWKLLFNAPTRFFSHGCVRVEKVTELARLLLKDDSVTFNAVLQRGDSLNTEPTPIRLKKSVPVVIVYETAWPDVHGTVRFFTDIYRLRSHTVTRKSE
jgi:L,D-transpeptidase YcbB